MASRFLGSFVNIWESLPKLPSWWWTLCIHPTVPEFHRGWEFNPVPTKWMQPCCTNIFLSRLFGLWLGSRRQFDQHHSCSCRFHVAHGLASTLFNLPSVSVDRARFCCVTLVCLMSLIMFHCDATGCWSVKLHNIWVGYEMHPEPFLCFVLLSLNVG